MKAPKTPSQRGKAARLRGQRHEQKVVNLFKAIYPETFRHLESQKHEAAKKVDVNTAGPFIVQCKHEQEYVPANEIFKTPEQEGRIVLLVSGGHGVKLPDLVVLRWLDLDRFTGPFTPHHTIANSGKYPSLNKALAELKKMKWCKLPVLGMGNKKESVLLCAMLLTDFLEVCRNVESEK